MNYYDQDGNPMGIKAWHEKYQDHKSRRVAHDEVCGYRVSTVFLGLDHSFSPEGPPLIFETMVFPGDSYVEEYAERYTTREEAEEGHQRAIAWVRKQQEEDLPLEMVDDHT